MTIKLELTPQEMQIIGAALGNMPYREVAQLVASINEQVQKQNQQEEK